MFWSFLPEARNAVDAAGRFAAGLVDPGRLTASQ
jgi:hypothetical protein